METIQYKKEHNNDWNQYITSSKNGLFIFHRNYMEYHSDRFVDNSLLFFQNSKLLCVLPANLNGETLESHGGLTYGGFLLNNDIKTFDVVCAFDSLIAYCKKNSIKRVIYKTIPYIYHRIPSEEDRYALFKIGAKLIRRDVSSAICLKNKIKYNKLRQRMIKRAKNANLTIALSHKFEDFMKIVEETLEDKYQSVPTHKTSEIIKLAKSFPDNINLYGCFLEENMISGVIVYKDKGVLHTQYPFANEVGKKLGSLSFLIDFLIDTNKASFLNFGSSLTSNREINEMLLQFKESFGARTIVLDHYLIEI